MNSKQAKSEIKKMFPKFIKGIKFDKGKQDWTLLPWDEVTDIVKVLDYGAKKYDRDNWQRVPDAVHRYEAAFFRHMVAFMHGEKNDKESGLPHLAHAGCCLLFLAWFDKNKKGKK